MNRKLFLPLILFFVTGLLTAGCGDMAKTRPAASTTVATTDTSDTDKQKRDRDDGDTDKNNDDDSSDEDDLGPPAQFQTFNAAAKLAIANVDVNVAGIWPGQKVNEERTLLDTKEFLVSYNFRWGVLSLCTSDLLMIDLDYGDPGVVDKKGALNRLRQYAKNNNVALAVRESDRGIHAFIVSKKMDPTSEESQRIMWENYGDTRYISYSKIRGYCARIGPKVFTIQKVGPGNKLLTKAQIDNEFVSRKPADDIIGNKALVNKALLDKLAVNDEMVRIVRKQFSKNYAAMTSKQFGGKLGVIPKKFLRATLVPKFSAALNNAGFPTAGAKYVHDKGNAI